MAYTSGIFYINPVSGSDTARTALTSCTASNPSGSITRINKTSHGLTTGSVVDLTLFSTWLNDAWKITVVDADNFDLDGAVWQTTADASGTATPRGGASWSDAWKTTTSGATAARIQPGDTIRYSENAPVGTGVDATFTSGSKTVTLASALTKTVTTATTGWTASANITLSTTTQRKIGSNALLVTPAAGFTTGKVCYRGLGSTEDFSAYSKISFWFRPNTSVVIAANTYKICLCSDTTGDTIVNEVNVPVTLGAANYHSFVVDYGSALGSSIQSIAIYANSDPGTTAFSIDNIIAANDFNHNSIFGWEDDCYYVVQAIDGTTVTIDSANNATGGRGWYGTTGTAELFYATPAVFYATPNINQIQDAGTLSLGPITFSGGWNTGSNTRTGLTYMHSGVSGIGSVFTSSQANTNIENFVLTGGSVGVTITSSTNSIVSNCVISGCGQHYVMNGLARQFMINVKCLANASGSNFQAGTSYINCDYFSSGGFGGSLFQAVIINCRFANNASGSLSVSSSVFNEFSGAFLKNCLFLDSSEITDSATTKGIVWSKNHDQVTGDDWGFARGATINKQSTTVHDTEPVAWKVAHTNNEANAINPIVFKVGEFAVSASSLVTFTAWVKKDHATNVGCGIYVEDELYNIAGVVADDATAADNTDWQQLTITFTPSVAGIVPIYFKSWYIAGNSNTYLGTISCTQ